MSKETDYERKEKRFAVAVAAMNGLLASDNYLTNAEAAEQAVKYADALLDELERTEKPALSGWTLNGIPVEHCPEIVAMAKKQVKESK